MTPRKRKVKKNYDLLSGYNFFTPGIGGVAMLLVWFLAGALLGNLITLVMLPLLGNTEDASTYATMVAYPVMFIPPMLYASYKSRENSFFGTGFLLSGNHYLPLGGAVCAILAGVATLATGFIMDLPNSLMPPMPEYLEEALSSMTQGKLWVDLLCVSIFAPFFEEWLCRGMVLRGFLNYERKDKEGNVTRGMKPVWAIVLSAAFFAIIHANPWQAIPAFALGLLFGYVYYRTGSLKLTMLMHCVNNTFAVIMGNVDSLRDIENWMDILPAALFWAIFVFCAAFLVYFVHKFSSIPLRSVRGNCDEISSV